MPILATRRTSPRNPPPVYELCEACNKLVKVEESEQHLYLKHDLKRCRKCLDYFWVNILPKHERDHCPADICGMLPGRFPMFSAPPRTQVLPSGSPTNSASKSRNYSHFYHFYHFFIFSFPHFSHFLCSQLLH